MYEHKCFKKSLPVAWMEQASMQNFLLFNHKTQESWDDVQQCNSGVYIWFEVNSE